MTVLHDLASLYRRRIADGALVTGSRLPNELDMAEQHEVSRSTISRVVQLLKSEGLLHTSHAGTFVGPRPIDPRHGAPRISCAGAPWCNNFLELSSGLSLSAALGPARWIWRGSQAGRLYYCHQCAPDILERESGT